MYVNDVAYDDVANMKIGNLIIGKAPESLRVEDVTEEAGPNLAPRLAKGRFEVDLTPEESERVRDLTALGRDKIEAIREVLPIEAAFERAWSGAGHVYLDFAPE